MRAMAFASALCSPRRLLIAAGVAVLVIVVAAAIASHLLEPRVRQAVVSRLSTSTLKVTSVASRVGGAFVLANGILLMSSGDMLASLSDVMFAGNLTRTRPAPPCRATS